MYLIEEDFPTKTVRLFLILLIQTKVKEDTSYI